MCDTMHSHIIKEKTDRKSSSISLFLQKQNEDICNRETKIS